MSNMGILTWIPLADTMESRLLYQYYRDFHTGKVMVEVDDGLPLLEAKGFIFIKTKKRSSKSFEKRLREYTSSFARNTMGMMFHCDLTRSLFHWGNECPIFEAERTACHTNYVNNWMRWDLFGKPCPKGGEGNGCPATMKLWTTRQPMVMSMFHGNGLKINH